MEEGQSLGSQVQDTREDDSSGETGPADINLPYSDCVLVSETGREFPSVKGLLALKCSVFRGLVEGCNPEEGPLRIPVTGTNEAVELLWRQLHGIDPPLNALTCLKISELPDLQAMAEKITLLVEPAHKYDYAECSELIDTTLALPVVFEAYTKKARPDASGVEQDKERIMQLWSLACQYSLHRVLAACESQVFSGLKIKKKKNGKCAACGYHPGEYVAAPVTALDPDQCLSELSGTGLHNAAVSLIKILNNHLKHPIWID